MAEDRSQGSHKFAGRTEEARARQLANLKSDAAVRTGVYSEVRLEPLRERYLAELRGAYPGASLDQLRTLSQRKAMATQLSAFLDARGIIRHQRRGEPFPAAALLARLLDGIDKQIAALEEQQAERDRPVSLLEQQLRGLPRPADGAP
jgi:hypothetical protein